MLFETMSKMGCEYFVTNVLKFLINLTKKIIPCKF